MRASKHYQFRLPERDRDAPGHNDPADIEDLNQNFEAIDAELQRQKDEDERQAAEDAAIRAALTAHKGAAVLDHPDASVTDAKIGPRSIGAVKGLLQPLLTALGDAIKAITGTAVWNDAPATTLKDAKAHMDSKANPHAVIAHQAGAYTQAETDSKDKAISDALTAHKGDKGNPHGVTAAQAGAYTKAETDTKDKAVNDALAAHAGDAVLHVTAQDHADLAAVVELLTLIDCGTFTGEPVDPVALHGAMARAHPLLVLDGNIADGGAEAATLAEHMTDPNAHGNLIVDGNITG